MSSEPALTLGLLATMPTLRPAMRPKPTMMLGGEAGLDLEEVGVVDESA
jgi:hypothetical protein